MYGLRSDILFLVDDMLAAVDVKNISKRLSICSILNRLTKHFIEHPLLCLRNIPVDMSYTLRGAQTCSFQDAGEFAPHILNDFIVSYKREANMKTSPR